MAPRHFLDISDFDGVTLNGIVTKARAMKDARLAKMMDMKAMPFDSKRMVYGGFRMLVDFSSGA